MDFPPPPLQQQPQQQPVPFSLPSGALMFPPPFPSQHVFPPLQQPYMATGENGPFVWQPNFSLPHQQQLGHSYHNQQRQNNGGAIQWGTGSGYENNSSRRARGGGERNQRRVSRESGKYDLRKAVRGKWIEKGGG